MGNICGPCLSLFYADDRTRVNASGESSSYFSLSESTERAGDHPTELNSVEAKVSSPRPITDASDGLDSKLLASPLPVPPSLEEEKAYNIAKSASPPAKLARECILCMEIFTKERPEVRTLCACGVNKNPYHLECLLAWRSRSGNTMCPVCDKELFYEEDDVLAPIAEQTAAESTVVSTEASSLSEGA